MWPCSLLFYMYSNEMQMKGDNFAAVVNFFLFFIESFYTSVSGTGKICIFLLNATCLIWHLIDGCLHMILRFPLATEEELIKNNDDCAICWDSMVAARKLPCGHLFHKYEIVWIVQINFFQWGAFQLEPTVLFTATCTHSFYLLLILQYSIW